MSPDEPEKASLKTVAYEVTDSSHDFQHSPVPGDGSSEEGSLDKVRDILFGAQSREFANRFRQLENRLLEENRQLRQELIQSVSDLKGQMSQEVEKVIATVSEEQTQRENTHEELGRMMNAMQAELSQRINDVAQQAVQQFHTLGMDVQRQQDEMAEYRQTCSRVESEHHQAVQTLQADKADRAALAEMLMDVAVRLKVGSQGATAS